MKTIIIGDAYPGENEIRKAASVYALLAKKEGKMLLTFFTQN